jgi:DNA-binding PadR family transcriptional regulator
MNVRLLVLGLLLRGASHGYELRRIVEESRLDAWAGVLPGSIYHALRQLTKEGLIALTRTERTGARAREIYRITPAGRTALKQLVREAWQEPIRAFPTPLYGALAFRGQLAPAEERAEIERQMAELEREIELWERARPLKQPMTEVENALFDNGLEHLRADLALLRRLSRVTRKGHR